MGGGGEGADIHDIQEFSCDQRKEVLSCTREVEGSGADIHDIREFSCDRRKEVLSYIREMEGRGLTYTPKACSDSYGNFIIILDVFQRFNISFYIITAKHFSVNIVGRSQTAITFGCKSRCVSLKLIALD